MPFTVGYFTTNAANQQIMRYSQPVATFEGARAAQAHLAALGFTANVIQGLAEGQAQPADEILRQPPQFAIDDMSAEFQRYGTN